MRGKVAGISVCQAPSAMTRSMGLTPAALILIKTWSGPGSGSGTSVTVAAAPYSLTVIARITDSFVVVRSSSGDRDHDEFSHDGPDRPAMQCSCQHRLAGSEPT